MLRTAKELRGGFSALQAVVACVLFVVWFSPISPPRLEAVTTTTRMAPSDYIVPVQMAASAFGLAGLTWVEGGLCHIEEARQSQPAYDTNVFAATRGSSISLKGWALDLASMRLPNALIFELSTDDGTQFFAPALTGFPRPEVASYFGASPRVRESGFFGKIDTTTIPKGRVDVSVLMVFSDMTYRCREHKEVRIE